MAKYYIGDRDAEIVNAFKPWPNGWLMSQYNSEYWLIETDDEQEPQWQAQLRDLEVKNPGDESTSVWSY